MDKILAQLNDQQRLAVEHTEGPSLVIAGAGSGKTRVLTTRIAYLISKGLDPFNILALTFTNKASREMRERIESMVGSEAKNLWMGTFHSVFARILRVEADKIGYPRNFTIYDTDDAKSLIKRIIKEEELDPKVYKHSFVYNRISSAKNSLIKPREYLEDPEIQSEDISTGRPKLGEIYRLYVSRCFKSGALDFDDLLLKTYDLINDNPAVLNKYQHLFRYVLIDEFQDTNLVQYLIVKKLVASSRNLTVVGDDAQSIYSFRGANIKNILNFEKDYPELTVFKLEQNYRSTQNIVKASDNIIKKNKYQLPKNLWTSNPNGNKIFLLRADSENDEGNQVAGLIMDTKRKGQFSNEDFVILYRTNAQSRAFEEALRRLGLPYRIVGSLSFYQRKEIKDILAYFRYSLNTSDEESLRRIINYPARGIGNVTMDKLTVLAKENDTTIWDILCKIKNHGFSARIANKINEFTFMIKHFGIEIEEKNALEAAKTIAKQSGILQLLFEDKTVEGMARYDNLQTLFSAIQDFTEREDETEKNLGIFLQEISLLTDADTKNNKNEDEERITLMTVHSAKGLEFPVVFVVGMEENLFPSQLSMNAREDIEEERRLFYVAVTRAKDKLYLSYATTRFRWGNLIFCEPSRFLDEIDSVYLDFTQVGKPANKEYSPRSKPFEPKVVVRKPMMKPVPKANPDFVPEKIVLLNPGDKVEHERFGLGEVISTEGQGDNLKALILFKGFGKKNILLKFAKLRLA